MPLTCGNTVARALLAIGRFRERARSHLLRWRRPLTWTNSTDERPGQHSSRLARSRCLGDQQVCELSRPRPPPARALHSRQTGNDPVATGGWAAAAAVAARRRSAPTLRARLNRARSPAGPERPGLRDEGPEAGPAPEQVIDLTHERPGTCQVGGREVDASQLEPGLDGEMGKRVGQQVP